MQNKLDGGTRKNTYPTLLFSAGRPRSEGERRRRCVWGKIQNVKKLGMKSGGWSLVVKQPAVAGTQTEINGWCNQIYFRREEWILLRQHDAERLACWHAVEPAAAETCTLTISLRRRSSTRMVALRRRRRRMLVRLCGLVVMTVRNVEMSQILCKRFDRTMNPRTQKNQREYGGEIFSCNLLQKRF